MDISRRFRELRKKKGYTIYSLSNATGLTIDEIKWIESGKMQPSIYDLDKLMTAMGSSISEFFGDREQDFRLTGYERKIIKMIMEMDRRSETTGEED